MKYSIENIYLHCGQYDSYCSFEFYSYSNAYIKYGNNVHGIIVYDPVERKNLEKLIQNRTIESSTDGVIKIDAGNKDFNKISLLKEGFLVSDIFRLSVVGGIGTKAYGISNEDKEIPFTINVPFEADGKTEEDWLKMELMIFARRIDDGIKLLPEELLRYNTISFILNEDEIIPEELFDSEISDINQDALFWILTHKYKKSLRTGDLLISNEEYTKMNELFNKRKIMRLEIIKKQLGISSKQIAEFRESNPDDYNGLMQSILQFETRSITYLGFSKPIYWNFERYIHIFLRHYKSFFIKASTKGQGTNFQYVYKDILRLIGIIIKNNKKEIEESWREGKEFRKFGRQGYYYNGNYYSFRISENGKLLQFHPQE